MLINLGYPVWPWQEWGQQDGISDSGNESRDGGTAECKTQEFSATESNLFPELVGRDL